MRALPAPLADNLASGPVFTKDNGPSTRLTVQTDWFLNSVSTGLGAYNTDNYPVRWYQDDTNSQFASEVEIPNLKSVVTDEQIHQGAATLTAEMYNTFTPANGQTGPNPDVFGDPGHYAYAYGASADARTIFNQTPNAWANVLRENSLVRVYQGLGGWWLPLQDAVNQGYLILKGVYLLDSVSVDSQAGIITLNGRNMAKLLIEQSIWPPTCQPEGTMVTVVRRERDVHGTESSYVYGCRCDECKAASATAFKNWSAGIRKPKKGKEQFTRRLEVPIEDLQVGDRVLSCDLRTKAIHRRGSEIKQVVRRPYDGELIVATAEDGQVTRYTPDHHCITILGDALDGKFIVYLMRRGNQYRIGQTQGRRAGNNLSGIAKRALDEGADAAWILSVCDSREEATTTEHITSWRFGLPEWVFPSSIYGHYTEQLWEYVGDNSDAAKACLEHFGRLIESPFWGRHLGRSWSRRHIITAAANLLDGMQVLVADRAVDQKAKRAMPQPALRNDRSGARIIVSREQYSGDVVSLEVENDHTYFGDGILTHNCPAQRYTSQGLIYFSTGQDVDNIDAVLGYGGGGQPKVTGFSWAPNGHGYRLYGSDGGVFDYGSSTFKGSMAGTVLVGSIVDGDGTPDGNGYRITGADGGVFCFGTAKFHGSLSGITLAQPIVAMRNTPSGNGYWLVGGDGGVFCFGDAENHGNLVGTSLAQPIVDFAPTPSGHGYWMVGRDGGVFGFGDAGLHGNFYSLGGGNPYPSDPAVSMDRTTSGNGYWICTGLGAVFAFGDAVYHGGVNGISLASPITRLRRTTLQSGDGYNMIGGDGGVFCPTANNTQSNFFGSMPGSWVITPTGTYADYSDIIRDMALWGGFYFFPQSTGGVTPTGQQPKVYGNIETTGAYNTLGPLNGQVWDKQSLWDCMQKVAGIVSYILRVDDQGSLRFEVPNYWSPGNFLEDGTPTSFIPAFVDGQNMTGYTQTTSDAALVSEILVGTQDPYLFQGAPIDTLIVRFTPPGASNLRGINKPAMIGIPLNVPVSTRDEEIMAELLGVQCLLANRQGHLTGIYNPSICVDDQIRIVDRNTGEADIHYVTGVHVDHDIVSGTCLATYTTYWLGNSLTWVVNANQDTFLAGSSMTASIYDTNGTLISEQLVQYLAGTGSVKVTQLVGAAMAYPPALDPGSA